MLFNWQVAFISCQCHYKAVLICRGVRLHLVDPVFHRLKWLLILHVVTNYGTDRISVVHVNHGSESFVTTGVPDMHLHLLFGSRWILEIWNANLFLKVGAADCYIVNLIESVLAESERDWRFAYSRVSQQDDLRFDLATGSTSSSRSLFVSSGTFCTSTASCVRHSQICGPWTVGLLSFGWATATAATPTFLRCRLLLFVCHVDFNLIKL